MPPVHSALFESPAGGSDGVEGDVDALAAGAGVSVAPSSLGLGGSLDGSTVPIGSISIGLRAA